MRSLLKASGVAVLLAAVCLLAANGGVQASRMGAMRMLHHESGIGGCYAHNGNGIVVVNTVVFGFGGVVITDTTILTDGRDVYLEGGIVFGVVYGGIIFPPERAIFFPTAIVSVVVFGPVFAQSILIGPSGFFYFSQTIFYTRGGVRIFNPVGYRGSFYSSTGTELGSFSSGIPRITSTEVLQQNKIDTDVKPPQRTIMSPAAAGKQPISTAIGQKGVQVTPGAAPPTASAPDVAASEKGAAQPPSALSSPPSSAASPPMSGQSPISQAPGSGPASPMPSDASPPSNMSPAPQSPPAAASPSDAPVSPVSPPVSPAMNSNSPADPSGSPSPTYSPENSPASPSPMPANSPMQTATPSFSPSSYAPAQPSAPMNTPPSYSPQQTMMPSYSPPSGQGSGSGSGPSSYESNGSGNGGNSGSGSGQSSDSGSGSSSYGSSGGSSSSSNGSSGGASATNTGSGSGSSSGSDLGGLFG
ncbi:hypothetical protein CVIRNUC_010173 [Coccomyxa viridis]|uniref:Uncharacterized protein n=1 Tax=Coccomyxa viridis TaxID=1274662 RepID=A0AAV1IHZ8_9CHLO|nr:hypothetical protein CVIRNUC_010173 [Coccomyxa viridis]